MTEDIKTPKQLTMFDAQSLLETFGDRLFVSSLDVAYHFEKQHKNVLRDIEAIECSTEFRRLNFEPSSYYNSQNKPMPMFKLTRDGFAMLVMGFTGAKATFWKERYIQAFNLMETELRKQAIIKAETRGRAKTIRVAATDSYKEHGATEWFHYTNNTDAIYEILFGGTAAQLRRKWELPIRANVRDHLTVEQLNTIIQIEGAITLQLEARKITNPADQLRVVRHVALSYRTLIEAPLALVGMTPSADDLIHQGDVANISGAAPPAHRQKPPSRHKKPSPLPRAQPCFPSSSPVDSRLAARYPSTHAPRHISMSVSPIFQRSAISRISAGIFSSAICQGCSVTQSPTTSPKPLPHNSAAPLPPSTDCPPRANHPRGTQFAPPVSTSSRSSPDPTA